MPPFLFANPAIAFGIFVYFVPYKNLQNIQDLQKDGLIKLDKIINLLEKK